MGREARIAWGLSATDRAVFEWRLLSDGAHAPTGLTKPVPLVSNDGADGTDGLCGKAPR